MTFIDNMRLGHKLGSVFAVLVAILVAAGGMTFLELERSSRLSAEMGRVSMLRQSVDRIEEHALRQLLDIRGLLLTGDRSAIGDFNARGSALDAEYGEARAMAEGYAEVATLLDGLVRINTDWRGTAERQIGLMSRPLTVDEARMVEANGAGARYVEAIRAQATDLAARVQATVDAAQRAEDAAFGLVRTLAVASALIGTAVAVVAYLLLVKGIAAPIRAMAARVVDMAGGHYDDAVPGIGRRDEVGQMAQAVEVFRLGMIENRRLQTEALARQRAEVERAERLRGLSYAFEADAKSMTDQLASASTELESTANVLNQIAAQSSERATVVAAASEETSANVQVVASASTELAASITEITRQVTSANELASSTQVEATSTREAVHDLAESVQRIDAVVTLIQEIAAQTNLLALNATIEAARAGEHGKGFAVVASEVKALAGQTAKATEEITAQIQAVQGRGRAAADAIAKIVDRVGEVQHVASGVAAAVEQQDAATREISRSVEEVAMAANDVSRNTAAVRAAADETGASSAQVLVTAGDLSRQAEVLRARVAGFLDSVRAA